MATGPYGRAVLSVGLTGGIGSGKSAVSALLADQGAVVVDADLVAREVVAQGTPGLAAMAQAFGSEVLQPDGALDRAALGQRVFADSSARETLNDIIHPLIGRRTEELTRAAELAGTQVLVHDVPLLVENGLGATYHLVVVVDAPLEVRLERLGARGLSPEQARSRMAAQAGYDRRRAVADVWLDNGGSRRQLADQVGRLWRERLVPYAENLAAGRNAERGAVTLVPYDPDWPVAAARLVSRVRLLCGGDMLTAVEHIGSTAVPGLAAKDVVDLQVEVPSWDLVEAAGPLLADGGFPRREDIAGDPVRTGIDPDPAQWRKRVHRNADPGRDVNVHVRVAGTTAARLTVLFRDLLRADAGTRDAYEREKRLLAARHRDDVEAYAEGKTPFILAAVRGRLG